MQCSTCKTLCKGLFGGYWCPYFIDTVPVIKHPETEYCQKYKEGECE